MQHLGADSDTLALYQPLKAQDLVVSKEVTEENRHGQGSDRLTWFWRINNAEDSQKNQWMNECEFSCHLMFVQGNQLIFFISSLPCELVESKSTI